MGLFDGIVEIFGPHVAGALARVHAAKTNVSGATIEKFVKEIQEGAGSEQWHWGAGQAKSLGVEHMSVVGDIQDILTALEASWTGGAADRVRAHIEPAVQAAAHAGNTFLENGANLDDVAHGFDYTKNNLRPMPPQPPEKSTFDSLSPWDTDTEDRINEYNDTARHNKEVYEKYIAHAQDSGAKVQNYYGTVNPFTSGAVTVNGFEPQTVVAGTGLDSGPGTPRGGAIFAPHSSGGQVTDSGSGSVMPPAHQPSNVGYAPPPNSVGDDGTHIAGFTPPPSLNVPGAPNPSTSGGLPAPAPGTPGLGGLGGPVVGGLGGVPKPGVGAGPAAPGSGPGGGKSVGAVPGGGAARPGGLVGGIPGGTSGRGMGAPMVGMPAGGARNPRGEDADHERKYGLAGSTIFEPDSDEDGPLDPKTGQRTVPPTIGA